MSFCRQPWDRMEAITRVPSMRYEDKSFRGLEKPHLLKEAATIEEYFYIHVYIFASPGWKGGINERGDYPLCVCI
ncbi:hypothetical protein AAC387_Pa07g3852 [Persea americana]